MQEELKQMNNVKLLYYIIKLCEENNLEEIRSIFSSNLLSDKKFAGYDFLVHTAAKNENIEILDYFCSFPDKKIRKKMFQGPIIHLLFGYYGENKDKVVDYLLKKYPKEAENLIEKNIEAFLDLLIKNDQLEKFDKLFNKVKDVSSLNTETLLKSSIAESSYQCFRYLLDKLSVPNDKQLEQLLYACLMQTKLDFLETLFTKTELNLQKHLTDYTFVSLCVSGKNEALEYVFNKKFVPSEESFITIERYIDDRTVDTYLHDQLCSSYKNVKILMNKTKLEEQLKYNNKNTANKNKL